MEAREAGLMQSLEAKQGQDTAAIQQASCSVAHDASLVQGLNDRTSSPLERAQSVRSIYILAAALLPLNECTI